MKILSKEKKGNFNIEHYSLDEISMKYDTIKGLFICYSIINNDIENIISIIMDFDNSELGVGDAKHYKYDSQLFVSLFPSFEDFLEAFNDVDFNYWKIMISYQNVAIDIVGKRDDTQIVVSYSVDAHINLTSYLSDIENKNFEFSNISKKEEGIIISNNSVKISTSAISNESIDEFDTNYHKRGLTISGGNQNLEVKSINDLIDNIKSNCSIEQSSSESTNEVKPKNLFNVISNLYDTKLYKDEYIFYPIFTSQSEIVFPICKYCVSDSSYVIYFGRGMSESEVEKKIFVELEFEKFIKLDIITGKIIEESLIANAKKYVLEDSTLANLRLFKEYACIRNELLKDKNAQNISKYNNELAQLINNNELIEDLFAEKLWTKEFSNSVIEWEPENGINLIDDEILGLALNLANRFSKFFTYRFSRDNRVEIKTGVNICELCENKKTDEYKKLINDFEKQKLWLNLKEKKFSNSISESIGYCSEDFVSNCPLLVATYIKYLKSTNKLEEKLKEREEYRAKQL